MKLVETSSFQQIEIKKLSKTYRMIGEGYLGEEYDAESSSIKHEDKHRQSLIYLSSGYFHQRFYNASFFLAYKCS